MPSSPRTLARLRDDLTGSAGFTLIELLIVVTVIAIIAAMAVPNLLSSRITANENAAIATLRSVSTAQAQLRTMIAIDVNRNGQGEYGYFAELAGSAAPRIDESGGIGTAPVVPVLMAPLGVVQNGRVLRSGYQFRMFLPAAGTAAPLGEAANGGASGLSVDAGYSETQWCVYAWPNAHGITGNRVFFANQGGEILATANTVNAYNGDANPVPANAAFADGSPDRMDSPNAANTVGGNGDRWVIVQ